MLYQFDMLIVEMSVKKILFTFKGKCNQPNGSATLTHHVEYDFPFKLVSQKYNIAILYILYEHYLIHVIYQYAIQ